MVVSSAAATNAHLCKGKVLLAKCALDGCVKRDVILLKCLKCRKDYCVRHRSEFDHVPCVAKEKARDSGSRRTTNKCIIQ